MADLIDAKGEFFTKDPDATLDFTIDWASFLGVETIVTSAWTLPTGITQASPPPSNTTTTTTIWLSGGTAGTEYELLNRITTAARTEDRILRVRIIPYPALAANALVTVEYVKSFLQQYEAAPQDSVDNQLLGRLINAVSDLFEQHAGLHFKTANYVERVSWGNSINLKNFPVHYVKSLHRATRDGLLLTNTSTKAYATAWVSSDRKLYLNISGGASHGLQSLDLTAAAYDTLGELVTGINLLSGNWAAALASGRTGNERSEDLVETTARMVESSGLTLALLDTPEACTYYVDEPAGIIGDLASPYLVLDYRYNGSPAWVKYRAGYDTIPEKLQMLAAQAVSHLLAETRRDPSLMTEKIGEYSYSRFLGRANAGPVSVLPQTITGELDKMFGYRVA